MLNLIEEVFLERNVLSDIINSSMWVVMDAYNIVLGNQSCCVMHVE